MNRIHLLIFSCVMCILSALPAWSQNPPKATDLSAAGIEAKIKQLDTLKDLSPDKKQEILACYNDALNSARATTQWTDKTKEYDKALQDSPNLAEKIKAELALPLPTPQIPDKPLSDLQQMQAETEASLIEKRATLTRLEDEYKQRDARRAEIPTRAQAARERLAAIQKDLDSVGSFSADPSLIAAKEIQLLAAKQASEAEIAALEAESLSYDARVSLLPPLRDQSARTITQTEALLNALKESMDERSRQEVIDVAQEARQALANAHPAAWEVAKENAELAKMRAELNPKIQETSDQLKKITDLTTRVHGEYNSVMERMARSGLTKATGVFLRKKKDELPNVQRFLHDSRATQNDISNTQLLILELEEQRFALSDLDAQVKLIMSKLDANTSSQQKRTVEKAVRSLIQNTRELLDSLLADYDRYFGSLVDLDAAQRQLIEETQTFLAFINERVLWIQSAPPLRASDVSSAWVAFLWLVGSSDWWKTIKHLHKDAVAFPAPILICMALFAAFYLARGRLLRFLDESALAFSTNSDVSVRSALNVLLCTVIVSLWQPALFYLIRWRLSIQSDPSDFARSIATGLETVAFFYFPLEFLRQLTKRRNLTELCLGWNSDGMATINKNLLWMMPFILPLVFVSSALSAHGVSAWEDSLGRLAFIGVMAAFAGFARALFKHSSALMREVVLRRRDNWLYRLRYVWIPLIVASPYVLIVLSVMGYQYSAGEIQRKLFLSLGLVLLSLILHSLAIKWLLIVRTRLAVTLARMLKQTTEVDSSSTKSFTGTTQPIEEPKIELHEMNLQTRNMLRSLVAFGLILGLWFIWVDVLPALGVLKRVELWSHTVEVAPNAPATTTGAASTTLEHKKIPTTLADLFLSIIIVVMTVVTGKNVPGLLELFILHRLSIDHGLRYAIRAITRYIVTIIGVVLACGAIGIGWSQVQWLAAAVTVGLGFGLQEIFANFVSGLILLFERPLRVGDIVTVGTVTGKVTRIQIRATTITDWDRKELIVPNKTFITGQLVNWTLSDAIVCLVVPVSILYGTDIQPAQDLLIKVAGEIPTILKDPPPSAQLMRFGAASLDFELRVFIASMDTYLSTWNSLLMSVEKEFREANIKTPYPQKPL